MLDSILNTVRRGAERVQRRGEEVAHVARLRVEVFQLGRELDGLYARLGRSYHAGAEVEVLQGIRDDIGRIEDEIRARERLIEVPGPLGVSVIEIRPGRARVASDPGPRQYCVRQGWLVRPGEIAICAPNRVSVQIAGRTRAYDSLSY